MPCMFNMNWIPDWQYGDVAFLFQWQRNVLQPKLAIEAFCYHCKLGLSLLHKWQKLAEDLVLRGRHGEVARCVWAWTADVCVKNWWWGVTPLQMLCGSSNGFCETGKSSGICMPVTGRTAFMAAAWSTNVDISTICPFWGDSSSRSSSSRRRRSTCMVAQRCTLGYAGVSPRSVCQAYKDMSELTVSPRARAKFTGRGSFCVTRDLHNNLSVYVSVCVRATDRRHSFLGPICCVTRSFSHRCLTMMTQLKNLCVLSVLPWLSLLFALVGGTRPLLAWRS